MLSADASIGERRLPGSARRDTAHLLRMWVLLAALVTIVSAGQIAAWQYPDPDDVLRLVQVRDLLGGQGWFDLAQHRIDPLREVPMHWSRLVDLPLALVIGVLTPLVGQAWAEGAALIAVPLLTLLIAVLFTGRVAAWLFGRETGGWAVLVAGMMPMLVLQFQPLRIDHHGWQIACFAAALFGLAERRGRRGPVIAGLAMAWGMTISIELLPIAALIGGLFALRWFREPIARAALTHYLQALAAALAVLFVATRDWQQAIGFCDAIGPAHIGFFVIAALGTTGLRKMRPMAPLATVAGFGVIGAAGLACFAFASPACVGAPFGSLDPLVHDMWYLAVNEGRPIWEQGRLFYAVVAQLVLALVIGVRLWAQAPAHLRAWWLDYLLLFVGCLVLGLLVVRSLAFASLLATIPLAWLLDRVLRRLRSEAGVWRKVLVAGGLACVILPSAPVALAQQVAPAPATGGQGTVDPAALRESFCTGREAARLLARLPEGTIFAPLDIGPSILLGTDHRVVATGHHRNERAMHDVIEGFLAPPDVAEGIVRRYRADYVVLCTGLTEPEIYARRGGERSLARHLLDGDAPEWLDPVAVAAPASFHLYRVIDAAESAPSNRDGRREPAGSGARRP